MLISSENGHDLLYTGPCLLRLDLQFFADDGPGGEKTEEPTSKKLNDARNDGQVAKSQELCNAVSLIALFLTLRFVGLYIGESFVNIIKYVYGVIPDYTVLTGGHVSTGDFVKILRFAMLRVIILLLPIFGVGVTIAMITNILQVKWKVTFKPLKPKFSKLNPVSGLKKIFSKKKLVDLGMSIAKLLVIFGVVWNYIQGMGGLISLFYDMQVNVGVGQVCRIVVDLGFRISIIYLLVSILDLIYQRWKFHKDMMMTKQEVKDEYKNSEGDPQIKGKIKQKMMDASRRRMMQAVPEADVVITNPTHFAVALKYDTEVAEAPYVVAKGQDFLAQKIKEEAREAGVEIVENKPLARMLYHNVDIGGLIPPELYQAVAEVIAFVYNLREQKGGGRGSRQAG
ncbi:MAG: flagellar biosynthesis protein FlhB [Lachnospiraceae bacterium]|nr:flagellar biosynthesis protein FlhB [Lachnospiraceae bacterium]